MAHSVYEPEQRRALIRQNVAFWAKASEMDGYPIIRCMIREVSREGCEIVSSRVGELPEEFSLEIDRLAKPFRCRIAWRSPWAAGVRFLGST